MSRFIILAVLAIVAACEAKSPQKVVRGTRAALGEFPFIVSLNIDGNHFCGGSIIGDRWVVTAAHCIIGHTTKPYNNLVIRAGSLNPISGGKTYRAKLVLYHGEYQNGQASSPNDIALIELTTNIAFDANIRAIPIATGPTPTGLPAQGAGWGFRQANSGVLSRDLWKLSMTTMDPATCQAYHRTILYTHQVCAVSAPGTGICQGDSGGPLVSGGRLVGIVSYNIPCALGPPDVFSSVYHYADWIKGIQDGSLQPAQQNTFGSFYQRYVPLIVPQSY